MFPPELVISMAEKVTVEERIYDDFTVTIINVCTRDGEIDIRLHAEEDKIKWEKITNDRRTQNDTSAL